MSELVLQASDDLVARIAREGDPVRAVVELVWNAIDAEATTVTVRLERDGVTDAITAVQVEDDGHGISSDEVPTTFGRIGGSWKKHSQRSKNGQRRLHGSRGEGRLRAFALGSRAVWARRSVNTAGQLQDVEIAGNRNNRHVFRWSAQPASGATPPGTSVSAYNDQQRSLAALENDAALPSLRSHFAPVLNEAALRVSYDGTSLDPSQEILDDAQLTVPFGDGGKGGELTIRIIEWRTGQHRAVYYAPDEQHFPFEEPGREVEGHYPFSAYVSWEGLDHDASPSLASATWLRSRSTSCGAPLVAAYVSISPLGDASVDENKSRSGRRPGSIPTKGNRRPNPSAPSASCSTLYPALGTADLEAKGRRSPDVGAAPRRHPTRPRQAEDDPPRGCLSKVRAQHAERA